jgi:hypothetical protein
MGDVAASGGYYIAAAADRIVAQPGTVTGSIGVLFGKVNIARTLEEAGIRTDEVKVREDGQTDAGRPAQGRSVCPGWPGGFVSSRPRKKGFDKLQDKSLGGITHLIPITKIGPETIP